MYVSQLRSREDGTDTFPRGAMRQPSQLTSGPVAKVLLGPSRLWKEEAKYGKGVLTEMAARRLAAPPEPDRLAGASLSNSTLDPPKMEERGGQR